MAHALYSNMPTPAILAADITASATSITLKSGGAAMLPTITGSNYIWATLFPDRQQISGTTEIIKITAVLGEVLTVVRGQQGTTATAYVTNDKLEIRVTKSGLEEIHTGDAIHDATAKTPLVDADEVGLADSAASWVLKKFTLTTLWTWIQTHLASPGAIGATTPAAITGTVGTFGSGCVIQTLTAGLGAGNVDSNTVYGVNALSANTTGYSNVAVGFYTMEANTTGILNTALGRHALRANTTGYDNTALGYDAMAANTTGIDNVAVGLDALQTNTTGVNNTALGTQALSFNTIGTNNTAAGFTALYTNTTGIQNTAVGALALYANTIGTGNVAVGQSALVANTTGVNNVAVGSLALLANTTGSTNTALGRNAGATITTGSNVMCLGYNAAASAANATNEITLGDANVTSLRCYDTTITSPSDARDKEDIEPLPLGLDFINSLNPVRFHWDRRSWYEGQKDGSHKETKWTGGFIAQELAAAAQQHDCEWLRLVIDSNPEQLEAKYGNILIPLVKAVQELSDKVKQLEGA